MYYEEIARPDAWLRGGRPFKAHFSERWMRGSTW